MDQAEIDSDIDNAAPIRYLTNTYNTRKLSKSWRRLLLAA